MPRSHSMIPEPRRTAWTAERLQQTLQRDFRNRRVIVVSNREPCVHEARPDGTIVERHPISGLVTALDPVLRASHGTWVAHGSGTADLAVTGKAGRLTIGAAGGSYALRRVWLTRAEERGYYDGVANSGMWPLCHVAFEPPRFSSSDWQHYQAVNARFADVVAEEADADDPLILPGRRDEPRRQGIRLGARRSPRSARPEPLHGCRARADERDPRQPVRRGRRRGRIEADPLAPGRGTGAADARDAIACRRLQRVPMGGADAPRRGGRDDGAGPRPVERPGRRNPGRSTVCRPRRSASDSITDAASSLRRGAATFQPLIRGSRCHAAVIYQTETCLIRCASGCR